MKNGLTSNYIQKLERQKYWALALLLFLVMLSFIWLIFQIGKSSDEEGSAIFSSIIGTLSSFVGAFWTAQVAYRAGHGPLILEPRHRLAWLLISLGLLANGLGNTACGYVQFISHKQLPVPSFADIGFTLFYVLLLAGLLLLPVQKKSRRLRIRVAIDSLITTLCLLGISWYMLIGPIIVQARPGDVFQTLTTVAYPCWDLLLILAIVLFIRQDVAPALRPSLLVCSLGVLAQIWADSSYAYLTNMDTYHSGMPTVDPFWVLGYLLIGISSLYQYNTMVRQSYQEHLQGVQHTNKPAPVRENNQAFSRRYVLLQSCLISLPFLILLGLTLTNQVTQSNRAFTIFLDILSICVIFLIIIHYALVTYEHTLLVHEKEQRSVEAELLRKATASLSNVLEMDLLLNRIVTIGATELGFDAAALVIVEEYDCSLDEQSTLLARATISDARHVIPWLITGKKIPYCTALMGKEIEVLWSEAPNHPTTPIHQWHVDQHIQSSLFVPLSYQGKIRGSLAFSLRTARRFNSHEGYVARAFTQEAVNALEHAYLYKLARENTTFAQAMSNVAARLNSVVTTGTGMGSEIHHLIGTEGANALRADLAILYGYSDDGQFIPLTAVTSEPEPPTLPQEWPALPPSEYLTQLFNSRQPALIHTNQPIPLNPPSSQYSGLVPAWPHWKRSDSIATLSPLPQPLTRTPPASLRTKHTPSTSVPHVQSSLSLQTALQRRYIQTAILAPLIIHQNPMGLLVLARIHRPGTPQKRSFALQDLAHAQDFAGQASIAFTNARLYQQLRNAHQRMQELDQLKDQFMVTASHELRTPLTAVQGYLELLEQYHTSLSPEQQHEFLQKASRGCEELVLLLNNVMDASYLEIEAGIHQAHLQRVVVREMVENVVDLILPQATQEHRTIQITIPPHLLVKADPTRLRQVILNLSVNALKYSSPSTPLYFSAHLALTEKPMVTISVTDHGKGIKPQDQTRLFQRFVRLESDLNSTVRGSGLGLYISRRLIEAMNGKIWIESTGIPGAGTTFHVQLPIF
jgi:signal transduction histidine kinase